MPVSAEIARTLTGRQQWRNFGPSGMLNVARSRRCESVGVGAHGCIIDHRPLERSSSPKLPPNRTAERRLTDLENSLAQVKLDASENAPLLAPLLDIPLSKDRASTLAPEELRRRQLAALTNWVMAGARVQPVVLVFEDLHWVDPTTLDLLRSIAERGSQVPLYIVATTRHECLALC